MRRIWNAGEAPVAVSHAAFWQVTAGCGYFYIANDWIDDGSFEQDLFVRQVRDPTAVIDDPLIGCRPARIGASCFFVEEMAKEEFRELYPDAAMADVDQSHSMAWFADETVRVARYWYRPRARGNRAVCGRRRPTSICERTSGRCARDQLRPTLSGAMSSAVRKSRRNTSGPGR